MIGGCRFEVLSFFADRFSLSVRLAGFLAADFRGDLSDTWGSFTIEVRFALRPQDP
jgi:hypothetical protein